MTNIEIEDRVVFDTGGIKEEYFNLGSYIKDDCTWSRVFTKSEMLVIADYVKNNPEKFK